MLAVVVVGEKVSDAERRRCHRDGQIANSDDHDYMRLSLEPARRRGVQDMKPCMFSLFISNVDSNGITNV